MKDIDNSLEKVESIQVQKISMASVVRSRLTGGARLLVPNGTFTNPLSVWSSRRNFSGSVSLRDRVHNQIAGHILRRKNEMELLESPSAAEKQSLENFKKLSSSLPTDHATTFTSLGLDGLDEVELVMALESEFGITLSDEDFHKIHSIGDALKVFSGSSTPRS